MASAEQHVGSDFSGRRPLVSYAVEKYNDAFVGEDILPPLRGQSPHGDYEARRLHAAEVGDDVRVWGDYAYDLLENNTVRLLEYSGSAPDLVVPGSIDGIPVTSLANCLFMDHVEVESLVMSDSVEFLGHSVFAGCANLKRANLSAALEHIGATTFSGCSSLEQMTINAPVARVGLDELSDSPLRVLILGADVQEVEEKPLKLPALEEVAVDAANERFVSDGIALYSKDRTQLYRLVVEQAEFAVPDSCTEIADRAFDSLDSLERVSLPHGLKAIGRLAFAKTALSRVSIPCTVERIGQKAFFHCKKLESVSFAPGIVEIDDEAFAHSALRSASMPATLARLGYEAFEQTPAQRAIEQGDLMIDAGNPYLSLDAQGGLYKHDVLVEYIGCGREYAVRQGTHVVGLGAFRRHRSIACVHVPEGVYSIEDEAFRATACLRQLDLPESLEHIGDRAFVGTALRTIRLSKNVREIGFNALLVQGENQLMPKDPLRSVDLDVENPVFYLENGMLCQRGGNRQDGSDSVLIYVGPDHIVRIPDQVTQIGNLAFCGTSGVDELHIHGHLQSIRVGAFNTARSVPRVFMELPQQVGEGVEIEVAIPKLTMRFRQMSELFSADAGCTWFNFGFYDSWVVHATDIDEFAPAAYARLANPVCLTEHARELYEGVFERRAPRVCRYFADKGNIDALEGLVARGLLSEGVVEDELETASHEGRAQAVACLLELRRRKGLGSGLDFSL